MSTAIQPSSPQCSAAQTEPKRKSEYHILFIDDDEDLTRIMKARMKQRGIGVTCACNGVDGYRLAKRINPSLIVTDLGMPGGHGWHLIRRLKRRARTAMIPLIVISGIKDESRVATSYMLGAETVLTKPIDFNQLFREMDIHFRDNVRTVESPIPDPDAIRIRTAAPSIRFRHHVLRIDRTVEQIRRPLFRCG